MRYTEKDYAEMLYLLLKETKKKEVSKALKAYVTFIASQHDLSKISRIIDTFTHLYYQKEKKTKAHVISKHGLTKEQLEEVKQYIQKVTEKEVDLTQQTNERMLGGVILQYADRRYDASLKTKLKHLRHHLKVCQN